MKLFRRKKLKIIPDKEIEQMIIDTINPTSLSLISYFRDHKTFGNFIIEIADGSEIHTFISDRGEIYRDNRLIFDSSYHIAGLDDSPNYLIKAIKELVMEKTKMG